VLFERGEQEKLRQEGRGDVRLDAERTREDARETRGRMDRDREIRGGRVHDEEMIRLRGEMEKESIAARHAAAGKDVDRKSVGLAIQAANIAFSGYEGQDGNGMPVSIQPMSSEISTRLEAGTSISAVKAEMVKEFIREEVDPLVLSEQDKALALAHWNERFLDALEAVSDPTGPPSYLAPDTEDTRGIGITHPSGRQSRILVRQDPVEARKKLQEQGIVSRGSRNF